MSLLAYYPFDVDTKNKIGEPSGSVTSAVPYKGKVNGAYRFLGGATKINIGADSRYSNLFVNGGSLSLWIRPFSAGDAGVGRFLDKEQSIAGWVFSGNNGDATSMSMEFKISFSGANALWITDNRLIVFNTWTHVAMTYNSSLTTNDPIFYINGLKILVGAGVTESSTPTGTVEDDSAVALTLGGNSNNIGFNGVLDEIRIYNEILDQAAITRISAVPYGPDSKAMKYIANRWPVEEGTTARTTKQVGKKFLHPETSSNLYNRNTRGIYW